MSRTTLHITMYPWFAMGHLTAFLHISNKLAERGHTISFIIPTKTQAKLEHFNLHPHLIRFVPLVVPQVDGLPPGAETTADVPYPLHSLIMTAMDRTKKDIEAMLHDLMPDLIFFDFAHWIPALVRQLSIKSVHYCIISAGSIAYLLVPARKLDNDDQISEANLMQPPLGFPPSSIKFHVHEARSTALFKQKEFGSGISFDKRQMISLKECDVIAIRTCREIEGPYCEYLERQFNKLVLLSGYVVPEPPTSQLEEKWAKWLGEFKIGSVVYCAFGSECTLKNDQFQELLLGFELTNLPFFAALKPPMGAKSIEEALPKGYLERVEGRGVVHGGWVQQQLILSHPSVGCFVTHCGSGSLSEALVNECQLVLLPQFGDQFVNARMMGGDLKVGIEVKKGEEDGLFTRESVCNAVKLAMDENDEFAREVRANHTKWKDFLLTECIESSYTDSFIEKLKGLLV